MHLEKTPLDDKVHNGQPPYHAAMAKFQQALEKALKAVILQFVPKHSDLVFEHQFLISQKVSQRTDVKAEIDKVIQLATQKDVDTLFKTLSQMQEFASILSPLFMESDQRASFVHEWSNS